LRGRRLPNAIKIPAGQPIQSGIRQIPGDFEARIALLAGSGNGKLPRREQEGNGKLPRREQEAIEAGS
jgi:hypothetical protein